MTVQFVPRDKFAEFIARVSEGYELYGQQVREGEQPHLIRTKPEDIALGTARAVEPIKTFVYPPQEDLGDYFTGEGGPQAGPVALVGLTACDLRALRVLDAVFLGGDFKDPYYEKRRQNLLVVSMDCTHAFDVCFCTFFEQSPYPESGFDLNLSPLSGGRDGYLVEAGSEKGAELLARQSGLANATEAQLQQRDAQRKQVTEQVDQQAKAAGLTSTREIAQKFRDSRDKEVEFWQRHANKCVECGACNFICPACHCFLLVDVEARGNFKRFKNWDSCLYPAFARVAGGANPRARRVERLQNRYEKKFDFLPTTIKLWGCTGCGRCTQACAGDIDVREVLKDILLS
jgi:ferredoxin